MEFPPPLLAFFDLPVSGPEMLLVAAFVLMFFGGDKMPDLARGLAKGIRQFKKATSEVEREFKRVMDEAENPPPPVSRPAPAVLPAPATEIFDAQQVVTDAPPLPEAHSEPLPDRPHLPPPEDGPGAHHTDV
jgi:sec-independent protein translocase protein TatA